MRGLLPANGVYDLRSIESIQGITIHWTASPVASGVAAVGHIAREQLKRVADPNTGEKFRAIAYTLIVDGAGQLYLCHDLKVRTWHSGARVNGISRNVSHVGVCYIGDVEPNEAQLMGLKKAIEWVRDSIALDTAWPLAIEGHRDAPYATACPGPTWPAWKSRL